MATMREIIAAKRASAQKGNVAPPKTSGRSVPVLSESNGAPPPSARTLAEERALMEYHRQGEAAAAKAAMSERTLGEPTADVPYVFLSPDDSPEAATWKKALLLPANKLGIWVDPQGDHAWMAVESPGQPGLLLIHRLPLLSRRNATEPF